MALKNELQDFYGMPIEIEPPKDDLITHLVIHSPDRKKLVDITIDFNPEISIWKVKGFEDCTEEYFYEIIELDKDNKTK